jgi:hypothetical protein
LAAGIYDKIIAKWSSGTPHDRTRPGHLTTEDGDNSDDESGSHYSDEMIDDSELLQRFETRSLATNTAQEYFTVSGDVPEPLPPKPDANHIEAAESSLNDKPRAKKGKLNHRGTAPVDGTCGEPSSSDQPQKSKPKSAGSSIPKDPQRAPTKTTAAKSKGPSAKPTSEAKRRQPKTKARQVTQESGQPALPPSLPPALLPPPPASPAAKKPPRQPGEGRKKAQATIRPEYLISHGLVAAQDTPIAPV